MSPTPAKINPFPGLRPFTQEEDYLFFGREEQTIELLQRLGGNRFVAVVGTSGSGKSSLVRCGLLSELLGGRMLEAGAAWEIAVTHPGGNPLALLTEALLEADLYDREAEHARENLLATLSRSHFGLVEAVKQASLGEGTNFLLVVDQFEEIFRFHETGQTQQEMANEFVSILLEAAAQKEVPIYVVLTMRSDFIGECGQFEGLAEAVNRGEFLIPRLTREQYKRVIEGPIKVAGGQIAPRLLQRLLNDLGQQADQLPCLQHALMRTWNVWSETGDADALDLEDYQCVGRMSEALSLHADEIYESLETDRRRELCAGVFKALTVQESENRGIRRPQRLGRLCQILEVSADELLPIIDAYRRPGVTFLMPSQDVELTDRTIIDISHESLMRVWARLRHWVDEEAQAAGIYLRLSESAALYGQQKAGLYRDPELGIALAWQESQRPNAAWAERYRVGFDAALAFLAASREASLSEERSREAARQRELEQARKLAEAQQLRLAQQQRSARKLRKMIGGLAVVALIAGIACVIALVANNRANRLAADASRERDNAERNAVEAQRERETAQAAEAVAQRAEKRGREFRYATDMQLAARLIGDEHANARQVLDRLAEHDPARIAGLVGDDELRGFEWYYLKRLVDSRAAIFPGREQPVSDSTLTAEGELITLDDDGRLARWDVATRRETGSAMELRKGRGLGATALSADGRRVALAVSKKVHLVDAATDEEAVPALTAQARFGLTFSPDNRMLVTLDSKIGWWDATTGKSIAMRDSKLLEAGPLSISADGLTFAVSGPTWCSVFRLDPDKAEISVVLDKMDAGTGSTRTAAISPDGRFLAVSQFHTGSVTVFDISSGSGVKAGTFEHAASVSAIGFDLQGTAMATASLDGSIKIWPDYKGRAAATTTPTETTALMGHRDEITRISFVPGGKRVISSSRDMTTRLWDLSQKTASVHRTLQGVTSRRARFSPDGLLIAAAEIEQGAIRLRDVETGRSVLELPAAVDQGVYPESVAFSPDNRLLAVGFGGMPNVSYIELWEIDRGSRLAVLPGTTDILSFTTTGASGIVSALAFSPDGRFLAAGFGSVRELTVGKLGNYPVKVFDVATKRAIRLLPGHENYCTAIAFSHDGSRMASASNDGTARIWDTATWKTLHVLPNPFRGDLIQKIFHDVAFSPTADLLAIASHDGTVQIWNAVTGDLLQTLRGHANGVTSVAFSPEGRTLASGSYESAVRLWNVATWREVMSLDPEVGFERHSLAFSPDGSQLLATGSPAILWSTRPDDEIPPEQSAEQLAALLDSKADFTSYSRTRSENLRWHDALEVLVRRRPDDLRLQGALAAARANRYASRQEWKQAAETFDQLKTIPPHQPEDWFRMPGLLRLATALLHENRPGQAALLVQGGAGRQKVEGGRMKNGQSVHPSTFSLPPSNPATGELLDPLMGAINERLAKEPRHPGLLELRAEVAGQCSDTNVQLADYTAAIEVLNEQNSEDAAAARELARLYRRRGDAYVKLQKWDEAVADYARVVTKGSTDEDLLANEALAQAEMRLFPSVWTVPQPANAKSMLGTTLSILPDDSILAGGENPPNDKYRIDLTVGTDIDLATVRLEALTHTSLPGNGPGRLGDGNFALISWNVTASSPGQKEPITLAFDKVFDDRPSAIYPIALGHWNISGSQGKSWNSIWSMSNPVSLSAGTTLAIEMQFKSHEGVGENLGHFRLSLSSDPAAFDRESKRTAATTLADPWQKLAAAYRLQGDDEAIDQLIDRHPKSAGLIGDLFTRGKDEEKDWSRAVAIYSRGIKAETTDVDLLSKRARAYEALYQWHDAAADWARAAPSNPNGARLLMEFARRLVEARQDRLATTQRERARDILGAALQVDPEDASAIEQLAQLIFDKLEPEWVHLTPASMNTQNGAPLERQDDNFLSLARSATIPGGQEIQRDLISSEPDSLDFQIDAASAKAIRFETATRAADSARGSRSVNEYQIVAANMAASQPWALRGRFVRLDLPGDSSQFPRFAADGDKKTINLAELQAFQGDQNIALRKKARQSSGGWESRLVAEGAVDGNTVGNDAGNPYAHTGTENDPWWEVDLGSEQAIDRIVVWNRSDVHLYDRMNHFRIRVLDHSRRVVFEQLVAAAPNPSREIGPQAFIVQMNPENAESGRVTLRLPLIPGQGGPSRFRFSAASNLVDLRRESDRAAAMQIADTSTHLAAARALEGRTDASVAWFDRALAADTGQARASLIELLQTYDAPLDDLRKLHPQDGQLALAQARSFVRRGIEAANDNRPHDALTQLKQARKQFREILQEYPEPKWTVLKPLEIKSQGGATLTLQEDGSILASGENQYPEVYTLVARPDLAQISAIRLEAIPDPSFPQNGPGRCTCGNFWLNEMRLFSQGRPFPLLDIIIDDDETQLFRNVIDGRIDKIIGWGKYRKAGEKHTAYLATRIARDPHDDLKIELHFARGMASVHNLGRFRVSVTAESDALEAEQRRIPLNFKAAEIVDLSVALAKAHAQQSHTAEALASFAEALSLADDRARKAIIIAAASPFPGVLEELAERAASDGRFQSELARHFAEQGQVPLAEAARAKARSLFEAKLAQEPENSAWAAELADVLLPRGDNWTVVKPFEMKSESGLALVLQNDGSVFAPQQQPPRNDTFSLVFQSDFNAIRGLRLEALADSRLPGGGSGWAGGNFVLNELTLHAASASSPDQPKAIALRKAAADFSQQGWDVRGVIDGISATGWGILPQVNKDHAAVFELAEPVGDERGSRLTVRLIQQYLPTHTLGRFRLSVTADPATLDRDQRRFAALPVTEPWARLAVAYHLMGDQPALDKLLERHPAAATGIGDLFAADQDWERVIAAYNRALTPQVKDADLFAKRAEAYEKLQLWEPAIADWGRADELVADKNKRYGGYPSLIRRAQANDRLRQYEKALPDYSRAVDESIGSLDALIWRSDHWALRGEWKQAAGDYRQLWNRREQAWFVEWYFSRSRALLNLLAGDAVGYRQAASELLTRTEKLVDADSSRWLPYTHVAAPGMITDANRDRLTAATDRLDPWWSSRLKGALLFRSGKIQEAADLFNQNPDGIAFQFLASIAHHQLHHTNRARQLFEQGNASIQQERDKDPGCGSGAPRSLWWGDWSVCVQLQHEAARTLAGKQLTNLDALLASVKLEIIKAEYGAGTLQKDVTAVLQRQFAGAQGISLTSSNYNVAFAGDPAPNAQKTLKVEYRINGRAAEATFAENAPVMLPITNTQEPELADALLKRASLLNGYGLYDEALADLRQFTPPPFDSPDFLALRGRVLAQLHLDDEALADLNQAIEAQSTDALVYAARGRILGDRGDADQARSDLEKSLKIEPSEQAARLLAGLLLADTSGWTILTPTEMKSAGGGTLTLLADGSILASGNHPERDDYTITAPINAKNIAALGLELLPHESLGGNVGRGTSGGAIITELEVSVVDESGRQQAVAMEEVIADYEGTVDYESSRYVIDRKNDQRGWGTPNNKVPHRLVVKPERPIGANSTMLTFVIRQNHFNSAHTLGLLLGHFRLSVSDDSQALARENQRFAAVKLTDPWLKLAAAYAVNGRHDESFQQFNQALQRADGYEARKPILELAARFDDVLSALLKQRPDDPQVQLAWARNLAERGKQGNVAAANAARARARALLERQLAAEPDNSALAAELANLLLFQMDSQVKIIAPTAEKVGMTWRFSLAQPPPGWTGAEFDDSRWTEGPGGFGGDLAAPGLFTRTAWTTPDIWLRRTFEWQPDSAVQSILARVVHDDGFEIFLNGEQVLSRQDYAGSYNLYPLDARVLSVLKPGTNTLAVHCNSTFGGQHIDVGILGSPSDLPGTQRQFAAKKVVDPWSKLAAVWYLLGDEAALDRLIERHPVAAAGLGAMYSAAQDWKRAIAEYNRAITPETTDAEIFAARAEAHEKLEHWELAIADWNSTDHHAIDKKQRFGNPSFPALQHRAHINGRLQQWEQQIEAYTELLKPERFGDLTWFYSGRGEAYRRLRQFDKARADFDQAVKISPESERAIFLNARSLFFAAQGDWNQAAENMRQVYQKVPDQNREWWRARDAALIFAMAGDEANCRQAAQECLRKASTTNLPEFDYRWSIIPLLQLPALITPENRAPLGELAAKSDAFWRPRLQAAIHFRTGEYEQAAEIFEANPPGEYFSFLAAMVYQKLGRHDRARQLLEDGRTWVREQRAKDPGTLVPNPYGWQDWITIIGPFAEAADLILGKVPGEPRKLARQGQLVEAAQVYAQALAAAPDEAAQSRIVDEMALFEGMETAAYLINNDWRNAAASYSLQIEGSTDSLAWMAAASLWAYAGDAERHRETCQKMYERCHLATEHTLKVMLLIDKGPRLPADDVKSFYVSCDNVTGPLPAWYLATRALYECRRGKNVEAHQSVEQSLAAEKEIPNSQVKGVALAVNALTYAREKDLTNARRALDELNQVMTSGMNIAWKADGALEGRTILAGLRPHHDQLIPEILRREAEQLIQSTPGRR